MSLAGDLTSTEEVRDLTFRNNNASLGGAVSIYTYTSGATFDRWTLEGHDSIITILGMCSIYSTRLTIEGGGRD